MVSINKTQLIALAHGWHPHAEAIDCEDMRGPRSLFGESFPLPRPLRSGEEQDMRAVGQTDAGIPAPAGCLVLWENGEIRGPVATAGRILAAIEDCDPAVALQRPAGLDVPASAYIAGRCASSFDVAWRLLEAGLLPEWGAALCSCQTAGRGQMRRPWHSPRGNLYVSFLLPRDANLQGEAAALIVGGLLVGAFRRLGFPLSLKWPNDLLLNERDKVGGLLLEARNGETLAGLGVNLAECPPAAVLRADRATPAAVLLPGHARVASPGAAGESSVCEGEEPLAPFALWRHLVSAAILEYSHSVAGQSLTKALAGCDRLLAWKGRAVVLTEADGSSISGFCQGLGQNGGLLLRRADGDLQEYFSGSLSLAASPVLSG